MRQGPRLTVAVLSRNRPRYLEQILNALLVLARDTEVVVRDHSDDDRCEQLVVRVAAQNPGFRLTHIHACPRGQLENVLGAIDECRTKSLTIPHDDDLVSPNWRPITIFRHEVLIGLRRPPDAPTLPDLWGARHMVGSPSTDGSLRRFSRVTGCTMPRFRVAGAISTASASRCMSVSTTRPFATTRTNFGLRSTPMSAAPSFPASWVGTGHQNTSTVPSQRHRRLERQECDPSSRSSSTGFRVDMRTSQIPKSPIPIMKTLVAFGATPQPERRTTHG